MIENYRKMQALEGVSKFDFEMWKKVNLFLSMGGLEKQDNYTGAGKSKPYYDKSRSILLSVCYLFIMYVYIV